MTWMTNILTNPIRLLIVMLAASGLLLGISGTALADPEPKAPTPFFYVASTGTGTAQVAAGTMNNGYMVGVVVVNISSDPSAAISGKLVGTSVPNGNFVIP